MVPKKVFPALIGAALLVTGGASIAADYRADEFLALDPSKALLSPNRLGPPTEFVPVPSMANGDAGKEDIGKGDVAKNDAAKNDAAKTDTAKTDTAKTDTAKTDTAKNGTAKNEPARSKVAKSNAAKSAVPKRNVATADHATRPARAKAEHHVLPHPGPALAQVRAEKPRGAGRTKLAHRRGNPLDAQARDTRIQPRIQTWPCNSGGICDWKQ